MILLKKVIPLDAREAMGFRGNLGERSCFFCNVTEENNFDKNGKLQILKVISIDKNIHNQKQTNHLFICKRPDCITSRPFV